MTTDPSRVGAWLRGDSCRRRDSARRSRTLVALAFTTLLIASSWSADENRVRPGGKKPPSLADLLALIEALQAQIQQQAEQIDAQQARIEEQKKRVEELDHLVLALKQQVEDQAAQTGAEPVEERLKVLEESVRELPEIPDAVVAAGDFPGSIRIPGTDAALRIGGLVRETIVYNADALGVDDRFVTAEIPMEGSEEAGKGPRLTLSARASRFNFDFRTPTGLDLGSIRAFLEGDFAGDGKSYRLRHAYGQLQNILVGQTWSTFSDPEAEPDGIDFEGLNAISLFRQPQVRWTQPPWRNISISYAIEDPQVEVTGAEGVSQVPDFVVRGRMKLRSAREGHIHAALLLRDLRAEPAIHPDDVTSAHAWGVNASGAISSPGWDDRDNVKFALYAGEGIGRYVADLANEGGQDGVYDPVTETLEPLSVQAYYAGYEHWWSSQLRSILTFGVVRVDNLDSQPDDAYHLTRRGSINLLWSPMPRFEIIGEFLTGVRINKDGERGRASQYQLGSTFRF